MLFRSGPSVAQLVEHGACNARVVGLIPGTTHTKNVCTRDCKSLWIKASAKWHILLLLSSLNWSKGINNNTQASTFRLHILQSIYNSYTGFSLFLVLPLFLMFDFYL